MDCDTTPPNAVPANRRIRYGDAPSQFFDLWTPTSAKSHGAVVAIHGGFWRVKYDLSHVSDLCAALAANGIATASLEYRRVGEPGGGWPGTFEDVLVGIKAACEHLPAPPVLVGHSAGGHLALRAASDAKGLSGVVALAPVAVLQIAFDLNLSDGAVVEFLSGTPAQKPEAFEAACPSRHTASIQRILVHGTKDETVPISISRAFIAARSGDRVAPLLTELEKVNHLDLIDPQSNAWLKVLASVQQLLD